MTSEPAWRAALADHVPQRPVQQVRAGVVAHRVGAPLGVDDGLDRLADAQPAVERAAMDDQASRPARCVSSTVNSSLPPPGSRIVPWSPTWPPPSA